MAWGSQTVAAVEMETMKSLDWDEQFQAFLKRHNLEEPRCASGVLPGWIPLLDELVTKLRAAGWDGELAQCKQKFGGLRWYIDGAGPYPEEVWRLIAEAEERSFSICEECGKPGQLHNHNGWLITRCTECAPTQPGHGGAKTTEDE